MNDVKIKTKKRRIKARTLICALLCASCLILPDLLKHTVDEKVPGGFRVEPREAYIYPDELPAEIAKRLGYLQNCIIQRIATYTAPEVKETEPAKYKSAESMELVPYKIGSSTVYRMDGTDYLTLYPNVMNNNDMLAVTNGAAKYTEIAKNNPDVKCYAYYITRSQDLDWFDEKEGITVYDYASLYERFVAQNNLIRFGRFKIPDFEYYKETGYKSDFHVNYIGSYVVYSDIYDMISEDIQLSKKVLPSARLTFDELMILGDVVAPGLSTTSETPDELFTKSQFDEFIVYKYDLPEYKSYVDDMEIILGLEEEYEAGMINRDPLMGHQFNYYGGQTGIVRFEFNNPDKPNLLICSDSQGRPSRKVLASHFNTTIYLDDVQWREADINEIIDEYNIDVMLLVGQVSMFQEYDE